jgi:DNA-directed RNA polymerase subunit alpha
MPKIEREAEARNYGKFVVSPLERGYGVTVGNALRRVLLSSLEGAAVTSVRISDVLHEFSDIPGVREDVIQVMLQIKQLRLKLNGVDSTRMHLEVRGEGMVTAADIIAPSEVDVINPDLYLFTVDSPGTRLDVEFTVERGRGYSPANDRSGHLPIGELPVDAIFSPVKRVNWEVSSARVGQSTNYDRLTLEIWTDGTVSPERALSTAAKTLIEHLRFIAGVSEETLTITMKWPKPRWKHSTFRCASSIPSNAPGLQRWATSSTFWRRATRLSCPSVISARRAWTNCARRWSKKAS